LLSFCLGALLGFFAAALGGWTDLGLSRLVDILMAIPMLIFALVVLSVVGTSIFALILVIAVLDSTRVFRLSRAVAMDVTVMEFVEAARLRGEGIFTPLWPAGAIAFLTVGVNLIVDWFLKIASGLKD
jgi:peptide/nickel transport system permease protein